MQTGNAAQRFSFYGGLALVTAATLMIQIIETRIISVTSWYHLAFFVISIAMFGLTAGAVWVYLRRPFFRPDQLSYHLTVAALAFALALVGALLVQLTIVTSLPASVMSVVVPTTRTGRPAASRTAVPRVTAQCSGPPGGVNRYSARNSAARPARWSSNAVRSFSEVAARAILGKALRSCFSAL